VQPATPAAERPRDQAAARRRAEILAAGLATFAEQGFAATRLEDVAARAGVAKGTIYLHFKDKQDLFQSVLLGEAAPLIARIEMLAAIDAPIGPMLRQIFDIFRTEIAGTKRADILRLILSEGRRFPDITAFHHREIVSRVLPVLCAMLERAAARGELATDLPARFPHLVVAPLLLSVLWQGLFAHLEPLDLQALFEAHVQLITGRTQEPR
jgi:AcrR family transcriptional regulator